jgi:hypothetical protein
MRPLHRERLRGRSKEGTGGPPLRRRRAGPVGRAVAALSLTAGVLALSAAPASAMVMAGGGGAAGEESATPVDSRKQEPRPATTDRPERADTVRTGGRSVGAAIGSAVGSQAQQSSGGSTAATSRPVTFGRPDSEARTATVTRDSSAATIGRGGSGNSTGDARRPSPQQRPTQGTDTGSRSVGAAVAEQAPSSGSRSVGTAVSEQARSTGWQPAETTSAPKPTGGPRQAERPRPTSGASPSRTGLEHANAAEDHSQPRGAAPSPDTADRLAGYAPETAAEQLRHTSVPVQADGLQRVTGSRSAPRPRESTAPRPVPARGPVTAVESDQSSGSPEPDQSPETSESESEQSEEEDDDEEDDGGGFSLPSPGDMLDAAEDAAGGAVDSVTSGAGSAWDATSSAATRSWGAASSGATAAWDATREHLPSAETTLAVVHGGLDVAGFVPGLGAIPDLANAGIYAAQGDGANALLSAGAAVPFVGDGAKAAKLAKEGAERLTQEAAERGAREVAESTAQRGAARSARSVPEAGPAVGSGNAYSVAFQANLPRTAYPGRSRGHHFREANRELMRAMDEDPEFARSMDGLIPGVRQRIEAAPNRSPGEWTWHHAQDAGVLQLVPRVQHRSRGRLQELFHPGGRGGYAVWGR